ncbi:MAG: hypothetical protein ACKVPJ_04240 [Chitinophagales bacterium]
MVKQYALPNYSIWIFAGAAVLITGILTLIEIRFGLTALLLTVAVAFVGYWFFFRPAVIESTIMKDGEPAMAIIMNVTDTGITINHNPRLKLKLEIRHQNKVPYEVEVKHNVEKETLHMFQSGRTLNVKIDSSDPKKIAILPR